MEPSPASRLKEELRTAIQSEDIVVGDEPCTYNAICDVITSSKSVETLWSKLVDIARGLEIPANQTVKITPGLVSKLATHESLFYDILEAWRGSKGNDAKLSTLLCVLEKKGIKACADALRNQFGVRFYPCMKLQDIKNSTTWGELSSGLKLQILEKEVFFQGQKTQFAEAIGEYDISGIDGNILVELANGKTPILVNNQLPDDLKYYVQRSLKSRKCLKKEVFQNPSDDIILVKGINKLQLTELTDKKDDAKKNADKKETDVSGKQISQRRITAQLILLECDGDYERICKLTTQPVHWIKFHNDLYEWVKSSGSVKNLHRYVHENQEGFDETELLSKNDKVVVIADSPGMGKTMLLYNIVHTILKQSPTRLVRFIVLKELVEELKNQTIDGETIISLMAANASDLLLGKKLVERTLKMTECILMFDGFDEVLLSQIDTAKKILQAVASSLKNAHIFVATRPHMLQHLEDTLHVLGYTMQPFQKADQMNFLLRFWQSKEVLTNSSTCQFAKFILNSLTSNMTDFERDITGIPLQCRLLAETYVEDAKRCFEVGYEVYSQGTETCNIAASIFEMYQQHMNICFKKIRTNRSILSRCLGFANLTKENQFTAIKHAHMEFALKLLFPEHTDQFQTIAESAVSISINELCDLGILEATNSNDIRFVHRTFAEYLVAWFAVEQGKNAAIREFLLSQVLGTKPVNHILTLPNDCKYSWKDDIRIKIKSFQFNFPVICYFINGFVKKPKQQGLQLSPFPSMPDLDLYQLIPKVFFASAYHNYLYGLMHASELSVGFKERANKQLNHDSKERTIDGDLLLITAKYADIEMMKAFCEQININQIQFNDLELTYKITPLHVAIQRGHYFLVKYLTEQYKSKLLNVQYLLHFCVYDSLDDPNEVINDKKLIIKLLTTKSKQWLDERFLSEGPEPLLQDKVNAELVECLIQEGVDVNVLDILGRTVIHRIAENPVTPEIFHMIIVGICERGFEHINTAEEVLDMTPLQCAVNLVELLNETLELFASNGVNFNAVNKYGNSVLFYAIFGGRSVNFIRQLIQFGADWKHFSIWKGNVLHVCAESAHYDALKYFIENHDLDINSVNGSLQTPLHLAVLTRSQRNEDTQRLLINHGANVCARDESELLPFQQAFQEGGGLSLSIIKLMEQNGLSITNNIASEVLLAALSNKNIKPDEEFTKVLEFLIQKQNSHEYHVTWNPWKFERIRKKMQDIIKLTNVTLELLAELKEFALINATETIQIERTNTPVEKSSCLYKILQEKEGSFEWVCLTLLSNNQIIPFQILRDNLFGGEEKIFTTAIPGVADLLSSDEKHVIILLTNHVDLTVKRIRDTIHCYVNVIEEPDISSHLTKTDELTIVKCRNVTINLHKKLKDASLNGRLLILCSKSTEVNQVGQIQSFKDEYFWEDLSMARLKKLKCTVLCHQLRFHDLFSSAAVAKHLKIDYDFENRWGSEYIMLFFKIGHQISDNGNIYLSSTIFHYFLADKLAFVGITQDELKQYTNLGHKIGCKETTIETLDYIVCEQQHHFDEICEQTRCNAHLIEHKDGMFRLVRTFGFDCEIKRFYEQPRLCDNFPECDCEAGVDDLTVSFTFQPVWRNKSKIVKYSCKLNDLLPKMQQLLKLHDYLESFNLTRRYRSLVEREETPNSKTGPYKNAKALNQSVINKIDHIFIILKITENECLKLKQIAVNSLFPNLQKSVDLSELEKYVNAGVLVNNNGTFDFMLESMAWYFIAKMIAENETYDVLITNILHTCFTSHIFAASYSAFDKHKNVFTVQSESIDSYTYLNATFFNFLEFFLSNETISTSNPTITVSKEVAEKWVHCCIHENQYNLLKVIISVGTCSNLLASRNLVLLAVQYASEPIIDLVVERYKQITEKEVKNVKIQLTFACKMSILHVAVLRGNFAVVRYLLHKLDFKDVLNRPDMKYLLHCCVVDTISNHDDELKERKLIIDLLLQHYQNMIEKSDNNNCTPLLVTNIHVDLVIHLINMGVYIHATDKDSNNFIHLCPVYMTPQHYHKLVQYICAKGESKIFHSKNEIGETPLHSAVEHLEILESTLKVLASVNVDFNGKEKRGDTVLILAVKHGRSAKLIDVFIGIGADASMRGLKSRTLVHAAAEYGNFSALRYFLTQECDVNATDKYQDTPLHLVLERTPPYTYEIVKILIEHGANVNAINRDKRTPLSMAVERNKEGKIECGTVELLKNAGALEFVTHDEDTEKIPDLSSSVPEDEESSTDNESKSS